jgi:beta-mannosidase
VHFGARREEVLAGADPRRVVLVAELHDMRGKPVATNLLFFSKARDLELAPPELTATVEGAGDSATVKVTARHFARAVWLTAEGSEGAFSDNFFDLLPGQTATVTWRPAAEGAVDAERLRAALRVRSVRDTY